MSSKKLPIMPGVPKDVVVLNRQRGGLKTVQKLERVHIKFGLGDEVALITEDLKTKRRFVEGVHIDFVKCVEKYGLSERHPIRICYTLSKPWVSLKPSDYIQEERVEQSQVHTMEEALEKIISTYKTEDGKVKRVLDDVRKQKIYNSTPIYEACELIEED